jgi:hypothetical protein
MFIIKHFLFLLGASLSEMRVSQQIVLPGTFEKVSRDCQ